MLLPVLEFSPRENKNEDMFKSGVGRASDLIGPGKNANTEEVVVVTYLFRTCFKMFFYNNLI